MAKRKPKPPMAPTAAAKPGIRDRIKELRRVRAGDLVPCPDNPRTHPDSQRAAMQAILREVGYSDALLAYPASDGRLALVDGHLRQSLDPEQIVPVLVTDLTESEARRMMLYLDPLAGLAEYDNDILGKLLLENQSEDAAIQALLQGLAAENGIDVFESGAEQPDEGDGPEAQTSRADALRQLWRVEAGQTWKIPGKGGIHRLTCGDCRTWLVGLADESAAMVFTDPPYGHNNNQDDLILRWECALGKRKATTAELQADKTARPIANDGPEANELLRGILPEFKRILVPGGCCCCCCCCGGGGPDPQFARWSLWIDEVIPFKMCVVWDKGGLGMGWHYRRCWECILVAEKPGAACKWYGGNSEPNVIRDIGKIIPNANQHPTEKPVRLPKLFIGYHSLPGETVLEPFLGSGSTLIACELLGRVCVGCELDPALFAVVLQRAKDAGLEPILES